MVRVKVVAPFKISDADPDGRVELPDRTTVGRMLRLIHSPLFAYALPVMVNGAQAGRRQMLKDGDMVVFVMPYSGG